MARLPGNDRQLSLAAASGELNTLVIQSHRSPLPYSWIDRCLESVRDWSNANSYDYKFLGDEIFDRVPRDLLERMQHKVVATDLARLKILKEALESGYNTVVWMDADFLVFDPAGFELPDKDYALGREVWIQRDSAGTLKVYRKVHNAFLMFRKNNSFLSFYLETAVRLLNLNTGRMPPQFIGPKLLTALHNVAQLNVLECAGMLSPTVIKDMIRGRGPALEKFNSNTPMPVAAANLCVSSCDKNELTTNEMEQVIDLLLTRRGTIGLG